MSHQLQPSLSWYHLIALGIGAIVGTGILILSDWLNLPMSFMQSPELGGIVNLPAVVIIALIAGLLIFGTKESATLNTVLVAVKMLALLVFVMMASRLLILPICSHSCRTAFPKRSGRTAWNAASWWLPRLFSLLSTASMPLPLRRKKPITPTAIAILGCSYLFISLPQQTPVYFVLWNLIGIAVYFGYAKRNAALSKRSVRD